MPAILSLLSSLWDQSRTRDRLVARLHQASNDNRTHLVPAATVERYAVRLLRNYGNDAAIVQPLRDAVYNMSVSDAQILACTLSAEAALDNRLRPSKFETLTTIEQQMAKAWANLVKRQEDRATSFTTFAMALGDKNASPALKYQASLGMLDICKDDLKNHDITARAKLLALIYAGKLSTDPELLSSFGELIVSLIQTKGRALGSDDLRAAHKAANDFIPNRQPSPKP